MKIFRIGLFLVTCFCSQAYATDDEKYPAAYFTPKVIYQDPALIEELARKDPIKEPAATAKTTVTPADSGSKKTANPEQTEKYPAAYFTPYIIYQDPSIIEQKSRGAKVGTKSTPKNNITTRARNW